MEFVDIVNEHDEVIGQSTKEQAHEIGALHRCVVAEIVTSKGEWLLVKQASDRQDPGQYVSPVGGHVKSHETNEQALKREAKEEVGFEDFKYELVGKGIYNREVRGKRENHLFVVYKITSDLIPLLNHESVDYKYFTIEEIKRILKEDPNQFGGAFHNVVNNFYKDIFY